MRADEHGRGLGFHRVADVLTERLVALLDGGVTFRHGRTRWSRACAWWPVAVLVAAFACWGAGPSPAAAAPNVVAVIKARDRVLGESPFSKRVAASELFKLATVSRAKEAQPALRGFTGILVHSVAAIRASSATKGQRLGKADYVAGNLQQVRGLRWFEREMADVLSGKHAAARDAFFRGQVLFGAGNEIANRGDRLLGLSTRY
jgi:hypothetical protein